ncbi:MAG: c-type cytochrome [Verrucomicrobia bacterium]|nr:c-type cytochrome [Verrucomicrobiota bacterium]
MVATYINRFSAAHSLDKNKAEAQQTVTELDRNQFRLGLTEPSWSMTLKGALHSEWIMCGNCRFVVTLSILLLSFAVEAQVPEWIWHDEQGAAPQPSDVRFFRKQFNVGFKAQKVELTASGDDEITVYLNGKEVANSSDWKKPVTVEVTGAMREGNNALAVRGKNRTADTAAVVVKLEVRSPNMSAMFVVTDRSWLSSPVVTNGWETPEFATAGWTHAVSLGKMGVAPWGEVFKPPLATPAESLTVLPGFKAELLKSASSREGSWICMTADNLGRLIISPEKDEAPLLRITLTAEGKIAKTETIPTPVRAAMGLLYAHDSLYLNGHGPQGVGLYRLIDKNQNDQFDADEVTLLKNFDGDTEHGYHAVVLGPDGMIYVMNGNHTKVPPGVAPDSPYQNYAEDLLLPRQWDARGHAKGVLAPGGYVLRTDAEGKKWELLYGGFRNTYDFDFSPDGEMFTFDSDMEWDVGAPWYRPTRILHCVIGGEYGWRSGTGKWPVYYPDSLPSVVDLGLSSPTGVKFGTHSNFPQKYREAMFAADWAYGKIFAVHLQPRGASYTGTFETFLSGKPLAVVDLEFGHDGAMYFIVGGWKIQSGLYRVSYVGDPVGSQPIASETKTKNRTEDKLAAEQRAIRHRLESFHGKRNADAIDFAWPYLNSDDRWLRYAARVAIESQDVSLWQKRALEETRVNASITALLALARRGDRSQQDGLLQSLARLRREPLTEAQALEALRVLELCFIRMGRPDDENAGAVIKALSRFYSAQSESQNRELCQLLVYLEAPEAITKTLALMAAAPTQEEQMHYAFALRNAKSGWTAEQRRVYFSWFNKALREYKGGASFAPYLVNIRQDAIEKLTETERAELASILEDRRPVTVTIPPRQFVREWTMADLEPLLPQAGEGRSFTKGKEAFTAGQCVLCHRAGNEGGAIGPDLTGVASRFGRRDLLDNILLPSKVISDRYQSFVITKRDGEDVSGCITEETDEKLVLIVNPLEQQRVEVLKKDIQSRQVSKLSQMPEGLLNGFQKEEILDLLAYLESNGRAESPAFTALSQSPGSISEPPSRESPPNNLR